MANKESTFGNAISLRQYLNDQRSSDSGYSNFMKITNINNPYAVPTPSSEITPSSRTMLFQIGDIIHDAQLVWVGDRFYLQGKKVYTPPVETEVEVEVEGETTTTTETTYPVEDFSPNYLFPFDAIAVTFENKPSDNTVIFDVNDQEDSKATINITSKTVTNGDYYGSLPTPVRNGYTFSGWYTEKNVDNTQSIEGTRIWGDVEGHDKEVYNYINGQILYAYWVTAAQS